MANVENEFEFEFEEDSETDLNALFNLNTLKESQIPFLSWKKQNKHKIMIQADISKNVIKQMSGKFGESLYMKVWNLEFQKYNWLRIDSVRLRTAIAEFAQSATPDENGDISFYLERSGFAFQTQYECSAIE